ncbi:MAG: TIGR00269 family protein [Candidatus Anstonellales archaeon]
MNNALKCHKCDREATAYLISLNINLCKNHFTEYFEKKFFRTIREFELIKKDETVAVGLSGGKDSSVMLYCLKKLQNIFPFKLVAITVDEGIRGYRPSSLILAKKLCRRLGIPLKIVSFRSYIGKSLDEIVKRRKRQSCSFCGVFRRYLLNKAAKEISADKLAIGHNLDDFAQTAIMNIIRNEPSRLARFGVRSGVFEEGGFVTRIKPLARLGEKEVAIYALLRKIPLHMRECPYARHALRQRVRKMINELEERYPGTKQRIFASFLDIQSALKKKYALRKSAIKLCRSCGEPSGGSICMSCKMIEKI